MLRKFIKFVLHICWYGLAASIITVAVAITLLRVLLPDIGHYREDIQAFVSEHTGYPVEIEEMNARWDGWIPNLYLKQIQILDNDVNEPLINFNEAFIELDPIASLKQKAFIPSQLKVSGIDLTFTRLEDGSIVITESGQALGNNNDNNDQGLTNWLRQQKNIQIEKANLTWVDQQQLYTDIQFKGTSIELIGSEEELKLSGNASLQQNDNLANIQYQIDIFGDILSSDWSGTINLQGNELRLGEWLDKIPDSDLRFGHYAGKIRLETKFNNAKLNQLAAKVEYDKFSLKKNASNTDGFELENIKAELDLLRKENQQWVLDMQLEDIKTASGTWTEPNARATIVSQDDSDQTYIALNVDHIKLADLESLAAQFIHQENQSELNFINDGHLNDIEMQYRTGDAESFSLNANFENLSLRHEENFSLSGLNGRISHNNNQGQMNLSSDNLQLFASKFYDDTLTFPQVNGQANWQINEGITIVQIENINIQTNDRPIDINGNITLNKDDLDPKLDLAIRTEDIAVGKLSSYLPKTMSKIAAWIEKSLLNGSVASADAKIKGPASKLPFKQSEEGILDVKLTLADTDVSHHPDWPTLNDLDANVDIVNSKLSFLIEKGEINNAELKKVKGNIADIYVKPAILKVAGDIKGQSKHLISYIDNSPLKTKAPLLVPKKMNLQGPFDLMVNLNIPIQKKPKIDLHGNINFPGNSLGNKVIGNFEDVIGSLTFTNKSAETDNLKANFFNRPVSISIEYDKEDNSHEVILNGPMDREFLTKQLHHYMPDRKELVNVYMNEVDGNTAWQANLKLLPGDQSPKVIIRSNLKGMALNFPTPFNKPKAESLNTILETNLTLKPESERAMNLKFGELSTVDFGYAQPPERKLRSLNVKFGQQDNILHRDTGVTLSGEVEYLDLGNWIKLIQSVPKPETKKKSIFDDRKFDLHVKELNFFNQHFNDVALKLERAENHWRIETEAPNISGTIILPLDSQSISLDLARLKLYRNQGAKKETEQADPGKLPSIHGYVKNFHFDDKYFGELYIETSKMSDGLSFDRIEFKKPNLNITAHGEWTKIDNKNHSRFNIDLAAEKLKAMLDTFKYESASIDEGKTDLSIKAGWIGSPAEFKLENLNGSMDIAIEQGQILDIDPKAGRLFGLLSIQTIKRRLSLDFSDLFGKGFGFDRIEGNFNFEKGDAYTNDLTVKGPSADIVITGRTGLIEQDYDQLVTVTPQVSDSLPLASAVFGPIGVGVGAVLYFAGDLLGGIPDKLDKVLQQQYTITGSWEEPVVEKLKGKEEKEKASG